MICPNCGKETPDGMSFCFNCGARLTAPQPAPQPEPAPEPQPQPASAPAPQPQPAPAPQPQPAPRQQYGPNSQPQYGPQYGPNGQPQYGPQYGPNGQPQYGPQAYPPRQPKAPSKFEKLLTGEPAWLLNFFTKYYNFFLVICSLISISFIGACFAFVGATGFTLSTLFLAGGTIGAAVFAQILLANKKSLGWIITLVAGGLRLTTVLVTMIGLFKLGEELTSMILFNCFYSITALMLQGALLALAVILFINNKEKFS